MMNKALGLLLAATISLTACQPVLPPLTGTKIGGPFSLIDENGVRTSDKAFAGKYRLIYFGYTFCPDVCPVDVQKLMQGLKMLEKSDGATAAKIQPLFITVDPQRDTPAVVKQFTDAFHPRLIGLTGSPAEIAATAKAFAVVYQKGEGTSPTAYLVDHSRTAVLFDQQGAPLAIIPQDGSAKEIADALSRWVK